MTTVISTGSNGTGLDDDAYVSDGSGSTLSSDLDHDITVDVLLPDNSIHKTTILASTPLIDLRTQLLAKFKFSPSSYNVDFISSKQLTKTKRKASLAVGKLDVTMITIKSNKIVNEPISPKMPYSKESTVRLLVRVARQRQSIIRVSPDVPLSTIFQTICDKLHLSEEARARLEFRHPTQNDVVLQPKLTLSQYNLRELYLADKQESPANAPVAPMGVKQKRKAPGPPRPPQPQRETTKKNVPEEVHTHKKRAAPLPPSAKPRTIKNYQEKTPEEKKPELVKKENKPEVKVPVGVVDDIDTKQATDELDRVLQEEFISASNENSNDNSDASDEEIKEEGTSITPTAKLENKSDDTAENAAPLNNATTNQQETLKSDLESDNKKTPIQSDNPPQEKEIKTQDENKKLSSQDEKMPTHGDVTTEEDAESMSEDDIIDLVNNPQPSPIYFTSNNDVGKNEEIPSESANLVESVKAVDENVEIGDKSVEIELTEEVSSEIDTTVDKEHEQIDEQITGKEEEFPPPPDSMLEDFPLPPPPVSIETENVSNVECFTIKEAATIPISKPEKEIVVPQQTDNVNKNKQENGDGFDLHIAESFNIPMQAIGEKKSPPPAVLPKPVRKEVEKVKVEVEKVKVEQDENANHVSTQPSPEEKLSEVDQTELEIKKIHLQINRMKSKRQKQLEANHQVTLKKQNGQAGTFICVPNQAKEKVVHENYEVPKQGIKLSKQGEIQGLNIQKKNKPDNPSLQQAPKRKPLPSYYKKFLGVNAFKDGVK